MVSSQANTEFTMAAIKAKQTDQSDRSSQDIGHNQF